MSHVSSIHIFTERQSTYNRRYRTENGKENCIHIIYTGIKIQMANLSHWWLHFLIRQGHEEIIRFVKHDISHWIWGRDNSHNLSLQFQPQIKQWDILVTLGKVQHREWIRYTISLEKEFINYSCTSYLSSRWWWRWGWWWRWWWRVVGLCSCHSKKGWSTPRSCLLLLVWRICQMTSWWQRWINKMCSSLRRSTISDTSSRSYNHNCLRR